MVNLIQDTKNIFFKLHKNFINQGLINSNIDFNSISFDIPDDEKKGDLSTNAAFIYKNNSSLKLDVITNKIKEDLLKIESINNVDIAGAGFINIFLSKEYLINQLNKVVSLKQGYGSSKLGKNQKINIEYVSANPTGPLHVAHSRGAIFGDVLSNLLKYTGFDVTREYYVNDFGSQIDILGDSLFIRYKQQLKISKEKIKDGYYPGEYLIDIAKLIINDDNDKWVLTDVNKRKKYFKNFALKKIVENIKSDLKYIGITFNKFTYEKNIVKKQIIKKVFNKLNKKNLLYHGKLEKPKGDSMDNWEDRKQLLFKSTSFGDDSDRPLLKSNNEWTYFANDSAYHYDKLLRGYKKLINVWGSDHIGYIKRMKSIVKVLSEDKVDLDIRVCQLVHLKKNNKPIKMSKRKGNFITVRELVDEVGINILRFYMLSRKNDAQIEFDLDKVIEQSKNNPVYYINYAYARCSSVLNIANKEFKNIKISKILNKKNFIEDTTNFEWQIIKQILKWPYIIQTSALKKEPHRIIYYLNNLSSLFHSFWNQGKENKSLRLIDKKNLNKTTNKIIWILTLKIVYESAFKILGIKLSKKM